MPHFLTISFCEVMGMTALSTECNLERHCQGFLNFCDGNNYLLSCWSGPPTPSLIWKFWFSRSWVGSRSLFLISDLNDCLERDSHLTRLSHHPLTTPWLNLIEGEKARAKMMKILLPFLSLFYSKIVRIGELYTGESWCSRHSSLYNLQSPSTIFMM